MDQYPKHIFDFVDQYPCILWISIPNSFLILWISIPVSCGSVSQINFKKAPDKVVKQCSNSGILRGLHRGCTGVAQGAQRERTGSMQCPFYPTFLLFKLERWNLVSRMESWLQNHFKFLVAHGHLQILCGTRSFTNSLWHTVIYKFSEAQGHSEHNSFDTSSFNPKGNHRLPWAPNFANSLIFTFRTYR